jgi:hypothetical protein
VSEVGHGEREDLNGSIDRGILECEGERRPDTRRAHVVLDADH